MTGAASGAHEKLFFNTVNITQGGYLYVFVSNESNTDFEVYFDDLRITHTKGAILQEDHYYPFGLNISALSSTAPLSKPNNYKFNGNEEQTEFDLNLYDFNARMYDATLGRFANIDPLADVETSWTPYRAFYDNPISYSDPSGLLEFANHDAYKAYAEENGLDVLDAGEIGSQGHWLKSDRQGGTRVWDAANTYNIKHNVQNQYAAFAQIRDLYKWVEGQASSIGHEVKWMSGAIGLVDQMAYYLEEDSFGRFLTSDALEGLLADLNVGIQNATLSFFNELLFGKYSNTPLKGGDAMAWDIALVEYEQGVVASPIYANASELALKRMNQSAGKAFFSWHGLMGMVGSAAPDFGNFGATVTDTQARIDIPLLMMYPGKYKPKWRGFKGKVNSNGSLNKIWYEFFKSFSK